ncbi:Methylenetetrahydrofolate reductase 1 [Asimina triloba]
MKLIDKINAASDEGKTIFSFEFLTPRPKEDQEKLFSMIGRMARQGPCFCDVTWRPGGREADLTLGVAERMQNAIGVETLLHLACSGMTVEMIDHALDAARARGIKNVLALKGDPVKGQGPAEGEFDCALDLKVKGTTMLARYLCNTCSLASPSLAPIGSHVKYIRTRHGDYFGIVVAGYPDGHPSIVPEGRDTPLKEDYQNELAYLKQKVDAGADLIITQLFFDVGSYLRFVNDCRGIGITCPILPGLLAITTQRNFNYMVKMCKPKIPKEMKENLELVKDDEEALVAYGIKLGTEMCKRLLANGIKTLHFYTINREKPALAILRNLGLVKGPEVPQQNGFAEKLAVA